MKACEIILNSLTAWEEKEKQIRRQTHIPYSVYDLSQTTYVCKRMEKSTDGESKVIIVS